MSHYTVAIFTRDGYSDIDAILAPFDEEARVTPYIRETKESVIESERKSRCFLFATRYTEWQRDPKLYEKDKRQEHIEYLQLLPELMKQSDEEVYQYAISDYEEDEIDENGNILSTYNPDSKWDWYTVGGRWSSMLILKSEKENEDGKHNSFSEPSQNCDAAFVADVDFDEMKRCAMQKLIPYEDAMKSGFYKEEYICRNTEFTTYAVVTPDGEWHAPGEMGWWAVSSDSVDEKREWDKNYHERFIKPAVDNGWYITIVDCHI